MAENRKSLNQLTKEDYQKALVEIQAELSQCVGNLVILSGYLESDLVFDAENAHYALLATKDIMRVACKAVTTALGHTYPMV